MENGAAVSADTQKTDPAMEPKLKAVDWDKVTGTRWGGMMIGGSHGRGEGVWSQRLELFVTFAQEDEEVGKQMPTAYKHHLGSTRDHGCDGSRANYLQCLSAEPNTKPLLVLRGQHLGGLGRPPLLVPGGNGTSPRGAREEKQRGLGALEGTRCRSHFPPA